MAEPARQLALDLPVDPRLGVEDFLVGASNELAYGWVTRWPDWPSHLVHLQGPPGSGKTHLGRIWTEQARGRRIAAADIRADAVPMLASCEALLVEDLERGPVDEQALFHLLNLARERRGHLLLTSAVPVERCGFAVPDLVSRLRLASTVTLGPPDDALLRAVLVKLFLDRQLVVDTMVVDYVAARIERSLAAAARIVGDLDREALSRGRRVTRPIAATILLQDVDAVDE